MVVVVFAAGATAVVRAPAICNTPECFKLCSFDVVKGHESASSA